MGSKLVKVNLMASQKLTNCCVAAIALVTAAYISTPHSSTIARLAFGAFCLAIHSFCFLAKASNLMLSSLCDAIKYYPYFHGNAEECWPTGDWRDETPLFGAPLHSSL
jgi:ABC-type transport system involved in multi-copper enzyme maturation permease subunit